MGKIKKIYKENFTVISTEMYRDKRLTMKDRGLLGTMLSLPENWDFSTRGLTSILPDGESAVRSGLQHLEKLGYLKRNRVYINGRLSDWEYIFSDYPLVDKNEPNNQLENAPDLDAENLHVENQHVENIHEDNELQLNINELTRKKENIIKIDDNKVPIKLTRKKITDMKFNIQAENEKYSCFNDSRFVSLISSPKSRDSLIDFENYHKNLRIKNLYYFKDISYFWLQVREAYGNSQLIINIENKVLQILDSFKKINEQESILTLNSEDINKIFDICFDFYDEGSESKIHDIDGYLANVVRSKFKNHSINM